MRWILISMALLLTAACDSGSPDGNETEVDTVAQVDVVEVVDTAGQIEDTAPVEEVVADQWVEPEAHPIGMEVPHFALEDLNPSSATFGQMIDNADLDGKPYNLIFFDSRCPECGTVADSLWEEYQLHPTWWDAQPTFAVQRAAAYEKSPESTEGVVDGNSMPYLLDTVEINLWMAFLALNHDFFAIDENGKMTVWLELYSWPDDLPKFQEYMIGQHGE